MSIVRQRVILSQDELEVYLIILAARAFFRQTLEKCPDSILPARFVCDDPSLN